MTDEEKEKENAELKAQVKSMRMEKGTLIAKLKSYDALWKEQQKVIKEKQAQIEKMKCCENCKHHSFWGDELKCNFFSYDEEIKCLKDKHGWELAE